MPERAYFVYVMSSLSRTLYTGVTNDLERRGMFGRCVNKSSGYYPFDEFRSLNGGSGERNVKRKPN